MASGVKVHDLVKTNFENMKTKKEICKNEGPLRIMTMTIQDGFVATRETFGQNYFKDKDVFEVFLEILKKGNVCYMVYDCHYETSESPKEDLILVTWCPDGCCVQDKMLYCASKSAVVRTLTGLKHNLHFNDIADFSTREDFAGYLGKDVISLERVELGTQHMQTKCFKH